MSGFSEGGFSDRVSVTGERGLSFPVLTPGGIYDLVEFPSGEVKSALRGVSSKWVRVAETLYRLTGGESGEVRLEFRTA